MEQKLYLTSVEIEYFLIKQLKLKEKSAQTLRDAYWKLIIVEQDMQHTHDANHKFIYRKIARYLCKAIDKLSPEHPMLQSTAFALKSELQNGTHSSSLLLCYKAIKRLIGYK